MKDSFAGMSLEGFLDALSSTKAVPGGGGSAALVGAIGVSLGNMAGTLTLRKAKEGREKNELEGLVRKGESLRGCLLALVDEDAEAFGSLLEAYGMPKSSGEKRRRRAEAVEAGLHACCETPLEIMRASCEAIEVCEGLCMLCSAQAISDVGCGVLCCKSALESAALNVSINTKAMSDRVFARDANEQAENMHTAYCCRADRVAERIRGMLL